MYSNNIKHLYELGLNSLTNDPQKIFNIIDRIAYVILNKKCSVLNEQNDFTNLIREFYDEQIKGLNDEANANIFECLTDETLHSFSLIFGHLINRLCNRLLINLLTKYHKFDFKYNIKIYNDNCIRLILLEYFYRQFSKNKLKYKSKKSFQKMLAENNQLKKEFDLMRDLNQEWATFINKKIH